MKSKNIIVRITEEQEKILNEKSKNAGFLQKSDYIRYVLFMKESTENKLDRIYRWVVNNE